MLKVLTEEGLIDGRIVGVDVAFLEANAEFLKELAKASGIETPTRAGLAKIDRKRPKKGSNDDWEHPGDPTAKIMKMKDGSTHLAHKAEHVVDLGEEGYGAILGVVRHDANRGDTNTILESVNEATRHLQAARNDSGAENSDPTGRASNVSRATRADC